jgi:hypothetical protein
MGYKIFEHVNPEVDHFVTVDPQTGLRTAHSVAATEQEMRQAEIDALRRSLNGVEFKLQHITEALSWYEGPPSEHEVANRRSALENERAAIYERIRALGGEVPTTPKKRRIGAKA